MFSCEVSFGLSGLARAGGERVAVRDRSPMKRNHWVILLLATALGLSLRLCGLSHESLYNDELHSWYQSHFQTLDEVMAKGVRPDIYPPAYLVLLHFWQRAFGDSEAALRLLSALAGTLWIPAMFLLGRQLFGVAEGLIAAGLTAVAWAPIYFSQEVRAYAFLILLVILMACCWTGVVRDKKTWAAVGYAFCAAAMLYLHPFAVAFVGLAGMAMGVACLGGKRRLVVFLAIHLGILVLYLPWLPEFLRDARSAEFYLTRPGLRHVGRIFLYMFAMSELLTAVVFGFYAGLAYRTVRKGVNRTEVILLLWVIVPIAVVMIKSIVSTPILTNRNMLICLPPLYLLLARAIAGLSARPPLRTATAVLLIGLFLGQLVIGNRYYTMPHKTQFREAVKFVVDREHDTPGAVVVAWVWLREYLDYYFEKLGSSTRVSVIGGVEDDLPKVRAFLEDAGRPKYIWFIHAHRPPQEDFLRALTDRYRLVDKRLFIKAGAYLLEDAARPRSRGARESRSGDLVRRTPENPQRNALAETRGVQKAQ